MRLKNLLKTLCLSVAFIFSANLGFTQTWELTDISSLKSSDIFVIVDITSSRCLTNDKGTDNAPTATAITLNETKDQITSNVEDNMKWNISGNNSDGYTFYPNEVTDKWLYCTNTNNGIRVGKNANKTFVFGADSTDRLKHPATTRWIGVYNNQDWRCYNAYNHDNIKSTVTRFFKYTESTDPDETAPVFTTGYPKVENIKKTSADLVVNINEAGKFFYKVVTDGATAPTLDEMKNADSETISKNTDKAVTLTGLTAGTAYDVYVLAQDNAGNYQETSVKIDFTTADANSPEIILGTINDMYYWGETTTIEWDAQNITASTEYDSILIYKGGELIYKYKIADITKNSQEIIVGDNTPGDYNTYGTDYTLRIKSGSTISDESKQFTVIPTPCIKDIQTNSAKYKGKTVKVKGLVTGSKVQSTDYKNFTLQDSDDEYSGAYAYYCSNKDVKAGDSVYLEGEVTIYNGLVEIGVSKTNTSSAIIINSGNILPTPKVVTVKQALNDNNYTSTPIKLVGVKCIGTKSPYLLTDGKDTITCAYNLYASTMTLIDGRKHDICGARSVNKTGQIWPRSEVETDIYIYSNDTTLSAFNINGQNALEADTIFVSNFASCKGIEATTTSAKASFIVKVNGVEVATADLANKALAEKDIVTVTVTAEDDSFTKTYKTVVAKEKRTFKFAALASSTFKTGDEINLTWTQQYVTEVNLVFAVGNKEFALTQSAFNANAGKFDYKVANSVNGNGFIKVIATADGMALDSVAVSISDTQAPVVKKYSPAIDAKNVGSATTLRLTFDEPVVVSENATMTIGKTTAKIVAENDTTAMAFAEGLAFQSELTVTISDGAITDIAGNKATIGTWKFTTKDAPVEDLYFSEYCEGAVGNNKYYEIYNPKATAVDLSNYFVMIGSNGGKWNEKNKLQLTGTLAGESVFTVANEKADKPITSLADTILSNTLNFNGDDALGLFKISGNDTILIDVFGTYGSDPGNAWNVAGIKEATKDHVLVRKEIVGGTSDWAESAGTDSLDSQWIVLNDADYSNLGKHGIGHRAEILSFVLAEANSEAVINSDSAIVTIETIYGTDLTKLIPTFTLSRGAQLFIDNKQVSSTTMNFSKPVKATVVAEDGVNKKDWTITVTSTSKLSDLAEILSFKFAETNAIRTDIMPDDALVDILLAYGTDVTKLTPMFIVTAGASVSSTTLNMANNQVSSTVTMDFSKPQTFDIYAQDKTKKTWTINVETEQPLALSIRTIQYAKNDTSTYINKLVSTEGVITSIYTNDKGTEFYIQDSVGEWSGILVYDEGSKFASKAKMGDKVNVTGIVTEYYTVTEITDLKAFKTISEGNTVEPIVLTVEDAKTEEFESVLVTIKGLTCTDGSGNTYTAEDETDNLSVYNKYKFSEFSMDKNSIYNVTGIMYYYSTSKTYEIIPRSLADVVNVTPDTPIEEDTTAISETISAINIYAFNNTIVVENADADIYVFDIAGKAVAIRKNTSNRVEIKMQNSGLYIIRVGKEAQRVIIK